MRIRHTFVGAALILVSGCGQQADRDPSDTDSIQQEVNTITVDTRRSLVVTEQAILAGFSFQRVMTQLAAQSGVPGTTALSLFQQWWDTQNPAPGTTSGPH